MALLLLSFQRYSESRAQRVVLLTYKGCIMPQEVTRRRFVFQTLGVIGGAVVAGDLLPLVAEAAKRKQILRVAIERDFETLRPELSAGDTANLLGRLIYKNPILWGLQNR